MKLKLKMYTPSVEARSSLFPPNFRLMSCVYVLMIGKKMGGVDKISWRVLELCSGKTQKTYHLNTGKKSKAGRCSPIRSSIYVFIFLLCVRLWS